MNIVEKYFGTGQAAIYTNSPHIPKTTLFNLPLHMNTFESNYNINGKPCTKLKLSFEYISNNCKHKLYGNGA